MTENLGIKWILIIALLGLTGWLFVSNQAQTGRFVKLGIDLQGGRSMTYEISRASLERIAAADRTKALQDTIATISKRIDTLGVRELTIRQVGDNQILIEAPKMSDAELGAIKEQMLALGNLEFLVGIDDFSAGYEFDVPGDRADTFEKFRWDRTVADAQRKEAYTQAKTLRGETYRDGEPYTLIDTLSPKNRTLPIVWMPVRPADNDPARDELKKSLEGRQADHDKIRGHWLYRDPRYFGGTKEGFTGKQINDPRRTPDRYGRRAVSFDVDKHVQDDFAEYTGSYVNKPMALCLNDEVWSMPTINEALRDSVQISNPAGFSVEDQNWLVSCLQSGSLRLKPRLAHEEEIGPALGEAAIKSGVLATLLSFGLTVLFMIWYYRTYGIVADIALILNLVLILGTVVMFDMTLSLPGIAGIILTIGMAVDANILVFERTREEAQKGKSVIAALQSGYDRAFITIFDSNLTTAISAALLIQFGSGPIKGFGVTLLAGLVISMFTALTVTKAVFGLGLKAGWFQKMNFIEVIKPVVYPFLERARPWQVASAALVILAVVMFAVTGDKKYGLDFTGGTNARLRLASATTTEEVQKAIAGVKAADGTKKFEETDVILRTNAPGATSTTSTEFDLKMRSKEAVSRDDVKQFTESHMKRLFADDFGTVPSITDLRPGEWQVEIEFKTPQDVVTTRQKIDNYADDAKSKPFNGSVILPVDSAPDEVTGTASAKHFTVEVGRQDVVAGSAIADLRTAFQGKLDSKVPFENVSFLGPNIVAKLKESAVVSVLFSLIAIILYVWFRFKEVKYGIAGVVALIHDVMVPLGLGILFHVTGIMNVPLNLQSIAAFLTIIGFSINDTIVIFDRVRENLGHTKGTFREIMNISMGQTLSRTILTSLTVFTVVGVLLFVNMGHDSPLEGFAFIMFAGVICGTYSTMFIACPVAAWLDDREARKRAAREALANPNSRPAAA